MTLVIRGRKIRVRWRSSTPRLTTPARRSLGLAISALLAPCSLISFTLTGWSVAADERWTSAQFFVAHGFFSHWQSWLAASIVLLLLARLLSQGTSGTAT